MRGLALNGSRADVVHAFLANLDAARRGGLARAQAYELMFWDALADAAGV